MVSRINKRTHSSISSFSSDDMTITNSPFSHTHALAHPHQSGFNPSPFTNHPLPYPPPGAIVGPTSTHNHSHAPAQFTQQPQREIKFIFETGRKEPKCRKLSKPKDKERENGKEITGGRKVLANKSMKDPNITRKSKPTPLNLKQTAKSPFAQPESQSHMPSPPLTARPFTSHCPLPKVDYEYPYSPCTQRLSIPAPIQDYHRHLPQSHRLVLPSIDHFQSIDPPHGHGLHPFEDGSPPLPIDAPIPRAPLQAYTPFFEDTLSFPEVQEEDEMDVDVDQRREALIMGLGLDLGMGERQKEMMDFVPRKPSLDLMMHDQEEMDMDNRGNVTGLGLGLGLSLFN
ncbi:hypothetical protein V865_006481 [Kwoniella europaea PYCC6329]|uniref:Uncharacterized protein n=1 Tax=Kwoniella europaea PYCC6329 TaxID=1423913 RepID=A0AAX4KQU8_9TREE